MSSHKSQYWKLRIGNFYCVTHLMWQQINWYSILVFTVTLRNFSLSDCQFEYYQIVIKRIRIALRSSHRPKWFSSDCSLTTFTTWSLGFSKLKFKGPCQGSNTTHQLSKLSHRIFTSPVIPNHITSINLYHQNNQPSSLIMIFSKSSCSKSSSESTVRDHPEYICQSWR